MPTPIIQCTPPMTLRQAHTATIPVPIHPILTPPPTPSVPPTTPIPTLIVREVAIIPPTTPNRKHLSATPMSCPPLPIHRPLIPQQLRDPTPFTTIRIQQHVKNLSTPHNQQWPRWKIRQNEQKCHNKPQLIQPRSQHGVQKKRRIHQTFQ